MSELARRERAPIALAHGFTQTGASWGPVVPQLRARLPTHRTFVAVDAPGHGTRSDVHLDLVDGARLIGDEVGPAVWIGYSMGGRLLLHLALDRPDLVEALVLIGATAGIDDPDERAARRRNDERLADEIERDGIEAFLERWLAQPLFAGLAPDPDDLAARRENTPAGLAASLRLAGTGTQAPLWDRLPEITAPTLVLAGERDTKFAALGRRLVDAIPNARLALVPGAGHAAHLEAPAATATLIAGWLPH
ncbi:MAG: alpha/beta fold hydrolase [Ilumatobacteraceae bacterium]